MDWDALIDQVAFGKTAPKKEEPCLGIYLSPDTIYIAQAKGDKGRPVVEHLLKVPLPGSSVSRLGALSTVTLNSEVFVDEAKIGPVMRQAMTSLKGAPKNAVVCLSHHVGLLRYFLMPRIDVRFARMAVPMEAKKHIPIPFESLHSDFEIFPAPADQDGRPRQGVLIEVAPVKYLEKIETLTSSLGLKLAGVEVASGSVLRLWNSLEPSMRQALFCQVHFDGGDVRLVLADKGVPVLMREVFLGKDTSLENWRKVDFGGFLSFARKQLGTGALGKLQISGNVQNMADWQAALSQEAGMPAQIQDLPSAVGVKGGEWGAFAAVGAASRFLTSSAVSVDLNRVGRVLQEEHRAARDILIVSAAVSLLLLASALRHTVMSQVWSRRLSDYRMDPSVQSAFANKSKTQIESVVKDMQDQAALLSGIGVQRVSAAQLLKSISDNLPEGTWLTKISYSDPLMKNGGDSQRLVLEGEALADSAATEQDMAYQYKDRLSNDPVLSRIFGSFQVGLTHASADAAQGGGGGAGMNASVGGPGAGKSAGTTFTITAKPKA